ncbi:hypothetical protein FPRO05_03206 [Fusarium proliferatum]|uniref:Uncharacterized protein n=1 Tax=Gibberella intermedia TaxID=948311 RepID=A0A365N0T5_GIBIN|nr:hypothetical protein FPRO05_03206 [Fusarium proliferatum]
MALQIVSDHGKGRDSNPIPGLRGNGSLIEEALQSLIVLPLESQHLVRVHLGCSFRQAIQTAPAHKPYNITSIVHSARRAASALTDQTSTADEESLEARIFQAGGTRALVAFATACTEENDAYGLAKSLDKDQLDAFIRSTASIKAHPKFDLVVYNTDAAELPENTPIKRVSAPRSWKARHKKAKDTLQAANLAQLKKRKLIDDETTQMRSRRHPKPDDSAGPHTAREPTEVSDGRIFHDKIGLLANSEPLSGTPAQERGRHGGEASSRNHQCGITRTTEAIEFHCRSLEPEPLDRHPNELERLDLEQLNSSSTTAVDPFDAESVMVPDFDSEFVCDSFDTGTMPAETVFDTARVMSANFDGFHLFNT